MNECQCVAFFWRPHLCVAAESQRMFERKGLQVAAPPPPGWFNGSLGEVMILEFPHTRGFIFGGNRAGKEGRRQARAYVGRRCRTVQSAEGDTCVFALIVAGCEHRDALRARTAARRGLEPRRKPGRPLPQCAVCSTTSWPFEMAASSAARALAGRAVQPGADDDVPAARLRPAHREIPRPARRRERGLLGAQRVCTSSPEC